MSSLYDTTIFGIFNKKALPEGAMPVSKFEIKKYLGRWYEIGRMDFFWEKKKLTNVYAEYSLNKDGIVDVKNTGYNTSKEKWESYEGEAKFRTDNRTAALEVSFFAGAWSGYNIMSIDDDYHYALVFGRNLDYLWLLSRDRSMPEKIIDKYINMAKHIGYEIDKIHWTEQNMNIEPFNKKE